MAKILKITGTIAPVSTVRIIPEKRLNIHYAEENQIILAAYNDPTSPMHNPTLIEIVRTMRPDWFVDLPQRLQTQQAVVLSPTVSVEVDNAHVI